ncbi:MAG: hypothetical protein BWX66_02015 [Deltaproteobacteria bacterium ADurb.Bin058]|nr:MAG: hypothetical protein BWX66_02015 [Deltaproteobacteria bacterium ADurb.Bin058]
MTTTTTFNFHTLCAIGLIARAAKADRGIVISDCTDTIASTFNILTRVPAGRGFLADATLQNKSIVTDAEGAIVAKSTTTMLTTVEIIAGIWHGNTFLAITLVALVTNTDGLIRGSQHANTMAAAGDIFTRVVRREFGAHTVLQNKTKIADADWAFSANCTPTVTTTVNTNAVVLEFVATITTGDEQQCD